MKIILEFQSVILQFVIFSMNYSNEMKQLFFYL